MITIEQLANTVGHPGTIFPSIGLSKRSDSEIHEKEL